MSTCNLIPIYLDPSITEGPSKTVMLLSSMRIKRKYGNHKEIVIDIIRFVKMSKTSAGVLKNVIIHN